MIRATCIACLSVQLRTVLDMGMHPFADRFVQDESGPDAHYPLVCDHCMTCGHVQLQVVTNPRDRYEHGYAYASGAAASSRAFWDQWACDVAATCGLRTGDLIVEAGSNDGYLCAAFNGLGMHALGVDPSPEMAALASKRGVETRVGYFEPGEVPVGTGAAALVVANNVLNHVDDLGAFMRAVVFTLAPGGTFVFQVPYWRRMVERANFDQVYHEHVSYFTVGSIRALLARHGMFIADVEEVDFHGSSLRVFARAGAEPSCRAAAEMAFDERGLMDATFHAAQRAMHTSRSAVIQRVHRLAAGGQPLVCAGASAKGNTFLNWHRFDKFVIRAVTDVSPLKIGRLTPGSRIPIVADHALADMPAPRVIILAWNIRDAIEAVLRRHNPDVEVINPYEDAP